MIFKILYPLTLIIFTCSIGKASEPHFTCIFEKDHNPPISEEANSYYKKADKIGWPSDLPNIKIMVKNYQKAIDLGNWQAMDAMAAMAARYNFGIISNDDVGRKFDTKNQNIIATGVPKNLKKAHKLYRKMIEMNVPLGYYRWAEAINNGEIKPKKNQSGYSFMKHAAELGEPMAQVALGKYYFYHFPNDENKHDLAEQYIKCASKQNNKNALIQVGYFYKNAKKNYPLAAFYYQRAASLGSKWGLTNLRLTFNKYTPSFNMGYTPDARLEELYWQMYHQVDLNPELTFPNLIRDHPLPRHPTQGYNANNPDIRPKE